MPEAILLKDVEGVGERGEVIDVSKGYLRNFLIPRKLAQPATSLRRIASGTASAPGPDRGRGLRGRRARAPACR